MAVETLTTPRTALPNTFTDIDAREIDFVTRFGRNWDSLREILSIMRPIKKQAGTRLVSYVASVTLEDGDVPEGAVIPYSKSTVTAVKFGDVDVEKYAKAATIEDVKKYGAAIAVEKTDEAFLNELQAKVTDTFFTELNNNSYAITGAAAGFQAAVAKAIGAVKNKFRKLHKNVTDIVVFVNIEDLYDYLGNAQITVQQLFGLEYVKNFLGATTMVLCSDNEIARGKVLAIPAENIGLYYIDPADSEFGKLGLVYRTDGETNLIGFHAEGDYSTAVGACYALMGMTLWYEYADGVAIIDIDSNFLSDLTVQPETDAFGVLYDGKKASDLQTGVAVSGGKVTGTLKFIEGGLDPSGTGPLAGDGYFLALKWSNLDAKTNSLKVGLNPSKGTGLVECFSDVDRNGVFKIDNTKQKVEIVQSDGTHKNIQYFDLSGLTLEEAQGA